MAPQIFIVFMAPGLALFMSRSGNGGLGGVGGPFGSGGRLC